MSFPIKISLEGFYARRDNFGRIIFDLCPTMHQHLTDLNPSDVRHLVHLGQFFPDDALNTKGSWQISIAFVPDECLGRDERCEDDACNKKHDTCVNDDKMKGKLG